MFRIKLLCCLMLTLALTALAAPAGAQDDPWHLRFGRIWVAEGVNYRSKSKRHPLFEMCCSYPQYVI